MHLLLEEQGLEVVALRQRVLKAEIVARAKGKDLDQARLAVEHLNRRHGRVSRRGDAGGVGSGGAAWIFSGAAGEDDRVSLAAGRKSKLVDGASSAEAEGRMAALQAEGHAREALEAAREAVSALKLALLRSEGEAELQAKLLVRLDHACL